MPKGLRPSLLVAALGGLILRAWVLASPTGRLDADEAVTVLMAEDFTSLEPQVFYWGQHYGGSLDALITAPLFLITGTSVLAAKLVMVALHALACVLVWQIGRQVFSNNVGMVAAAIAWVSSPAVIWWSTKTRGFYGSGLVIATAVVWLAVRLSARRTDEDPRADRRDLLALGFVAGLAWWVTPIIAFVAVPAVAATLVIRRDLWKRLGLTIGPFMIGSLPWWIYNLMNGFPSLEQPTAAVESTYVERLEGLIGQLLPMLIGFRELFSADWYGGLAGAVAATVFIVGLGVGAFRLRHRTWVPLAVLIGFPFVAALASTTEYVGEPRYGYMLAPVIALVIAGLAATNSRALAALPVMVLGLSAVGLASLIGQTDSPPPDLVLDPPAIAPLEVALTDAEMTHVFGEYWLAYRVTAQTDVVASPSDFVRDADLLQSVVNSGSRTWVFYRDSGPALAWKEEARQGGYSFETIELDEFEVFTRTDNS